MKKENNLIAVFILSILSLIVAIYFNLDSYSVTTSIIMILSSAFTYYIKRRIRNENRRIDSGNERESV